MTIFDSLLYPISTPTYDELEAIPEDIWNDFLTRCGDSKADLPRTIAFMFMSSTAWEERVDLLKRTILEYDVQDNR